MRPAPLYIAHLRAASADRLAAVRVILTDIDGTATQAGKIPAAVIGACERLAAAGVEVIPVTGRSAGEALGLVRYVPTWRRAIAENGGVVVIPDAPLEFLRASADRARLHAAAQAIGGGGWALAPCSAFRLTDQAWERAGRGDAELEVARARAEGFGLCLTWSSVHIHLTTEAPDKGSAALTLLGRDGIGAVTALAIGDAPNDEGLWQAGRVGVQVGTADVAASWARWRHRPEFAVGCGAEGWVEMAALVLGAHAAVGQPGPPR